MILKFAEKILQTPIYWTENNHLVYGFDKNKSGVNKDRYFTKIGSVKRKVGSAFIEAQIAAKLIYKEALKHGQEIYLCLSSGIDSQAMLNSFISSNVPFKTIIMKFDKNLNDFDTKEMITFLKENKIDFDVFDFDVLRFFESGKYLEYGKLYQCQSPQLAAHLYLLDQIKGCPVLSWQAPEFSFYFDSKDKTFKVCFGLPGCLHNAYLRYFVKSNRLGIPFFFLYTPEIYKAFYSLSFMQEKVYLSKKEPVLYTYEDKSRAYIESGFSVKPRSMKLTGFEKVRDHYDFLDNKKFGIAFNDRYRKPLEKLNPLPKTFQIIPKDIYKFQDK